MSIAGVSDRALVSVLRARVEEGKPEYARGAALPTHLKLLAVSATAEQAYADKRDTPDLVAAVSHGDTGAELPLYVRAASDLDQVAGRAGTDSALSREDLHQEAAVKLLEDARSGMISTAFGGEIGPYLGRSVRRHLADMVDTQRPGRPTIPGRERRRLREALSATLTASGEYDLIAAVEYARTKFDWTLRMFWAAHSSMFPSVAWNEPTSSGLTYAETTPESADNTDANAMVEDLELIRQLMRHATLTARERDVLSTAYGLAGPPNTNAQVAELLGISLRQAERVRAAALKKLTMAAHTQRLGLGADHGDSPT